MVLVLTHFSEKFYSNIRWNANDSITLISCNMLLEYTQHKEVKEHKIVNIIFAVLLRILTAVYDGLCTEESSHFRVCLWTPQKRSNDNEGNVFKIVQLFYTITNTGMLLSGMTCSWKAPMNLLCTLHLMTW